MKLLTKEIERKLPPLYANEEKSAGEVEVIAKWFMPATRWTWYVTEGNVEDDRFFGYVVSGLDPSFDELGYFSLSELESVRGPMGLRVERDRGFRAKLSDVMEKTRDGGIA